MRVFRRSKGDGWFCCGNCRQRMYYVKECPWGDCIGPRSDERCPCADSNRGTEAEPVQAVPGDPAPAL